jgi:hypothetical protein
VADTQVKSCEECGASVYPEHVNAGKAGTWGGKLCCVHCLAEHRSGQVTIGPEQVAPPEAPQPASPTNDSDISDDHFFDDLTADDAPEAPPAADAGADDLVDAAETEAISISEIASSAIRPFAGSDLVTPPSATQHKFKRHLQHDASGAIRCRIFHAKLNDGALQFVQDQINDWIDKNPEVDIKHLGTNVGVVEGKNSEPHLIITMFY